MALLNFRKIFLYDVLVNGKKMGQALNIVVDNKSHEALLQVGEARFQYGSLTDLFIPAALREPPRIFIPFSQILHIDDENKTITLKERAEREKRPLPLLFSHLMASWSPRGSAAPYCSGSKVYDCKGKEIGFLHDYIVDLEEGRAVGVVIRPERLPSGVTCEVMEIPAIKRMGFLKTGLCLSVEKADLDLPEGFKR